MVVLGMTAWQAMQAVEALLAVQARLAGMAVAARRRWVSRVLEVCGGDWYDF